MPDKKSKPSLAQTVMDAATQSMGGTALWDALTSKFLNNEDVEHHPKGERQGSVENLIKAIGIRYGTLVPDDFPYLEQYIHPESDVLRKTKPPQSRRGSLPYREPAYEEELRTEYDPFHRGDTPTQGNIVKVPTGKLNANISGLGRFSRVNPKTGKMLPVDANGALGDPTSLLKEWQNGTDADYNHIYDVWDFDTSFGMLKDGAPTTRGGDESLKSNLGSEIAKRIMQNAGQPYAIYGPEQKK
jgi:hypothetical protein